jgi:hypothetical protein
MKEHSTTAALCPGVRVDYITARRTSLLLLAHRSKSYGLNHYVSADDFQLGKRLSDSIDTANVFLGVAMYDQINGHRHRVVARGAARGKKYTMARRAAPADDGPAVGTADIR